jgi:hypothetical protein
MSSHAAPPSRAITKTAFTLTLAFALATGSSPRRAPAEEQPVLTFHGDPGRSGNFVIPALTFERARALHLDQGFEARFPGHVYAQPLYWRSIEADSGVLLVATEENIARALDARTGKEIWARSLGNPVPRSSLNCGNINPLGVTGTPVIDRATEAIYLDAMVDTPDGPRHLIYGLALKDGSVLPGWPIDVAEALKAKGEPFTPRDQNQRGALAILDGVLFVPYGGHWGDCGPYHGWIVGISLKDPQTVVSFATRGRGGGIWAPGGIATDGKSIYFATGNTIGAKEWGDGEAVFRLGPGLRRSETSEDYFAAADWRELDRQDADLGGSNPVLFDVPSDGQSEPLVLALGKDGRAYLLDRRKLGGFSAALAAESVSHHSILTAAAAYPADDGTFVAFQGEGAHCPAERPGAWKWPWSGGNGLTVLKIRAAKTPMIETAWCGTFKGAGSPIVTTTDGRSNPIVWIVGAEGDNRLHGFRGDTGEPLYSGGGGAEEMAGLHHFQTLIVAGGRLYVGADGRIYAFSY